MTNNNLDLFNDSLVDQLDPDTLDLFNDILEPSNNLYKLTEITSMGKTIGYNDLAWLLAFQNKMASRTNKRENLTEYYKMMVRHMGGKIWTQCSKYKGVKYNCCDGNMVDYPGLNFLGDEK